MSYATRRIRHIIARDDQVVKPAFELLERSPGKSLGVACGYCIARRRLCRGRLIQPSDGVYGGQFQDRVKAIFVHKLLCQREADATIAAGCESFPV